MSFLMMSDLKIATNRQNAKKSTGPRTDIGKARSALNAIKHGLSAQMSYDSSTQKRINQLVKVFTEGGKYNSGIIALAYEAAEAQVMLMRVKEVRRLAWKEARHDSSITDRGEICFLNEPHLETYLQKKTGMTVKQLKKLTPGLLGPPIETDVERETAIFQLASKKLTELIRYERHAANRRDKAFRNLQKSNLT